MGKRILLINSDLAKNRGDRAIAEGNIQLIRDHFKEAQITGISQYPERDKDWYGIDFIDMDFQSLNPFELIRLCMAARKSDVVLWGGGEVLKDYTNKAALWYWVIKMSCVSLANPNVYGAYQGVGPTKSTSSKKLIAYIVNRMKIFIVRDKESEEKLVSWGVNPSKVIAASDPAVLPRPKKPSETLLEKVRSDYDLDASFFENFICIGPRDWFHYKQSGVLPYKYRKKLNALLGKTRERTGPEHEKYIESLGGLVERITTELGVNVLFVPMHMDESDTKLCKELEKSADPSVSVRTLVEDAFSPSELRSLISGAQAMIGFRLHSNIIGISSGVPSLNIYYVDKGRVFFDQIGQSHFALPIETTLSDAFVDDTASLFVKLFNERGQVHAQIETATGELRRQVTDAFEKAMRDA